MASWVAYLSIAALIVYVIFFGVGVSSLPFYLPTELIPPGPRPYVMSVGCGLNWAMNFVIGMTFPSLQSLMGPYVFFVFAVFTSVQAVFLYFCLPETFANNVAAAASST